MEQQIEEQGLTEAKQQVIRIQRVVDDLSALDRQKKLLEELTEKHCSDLEAFWSRHPEAGKEYDALQIKYHDDTSAVTKTATDLEESIRSQVAVAKETVKNGPVQAVYSKGKVSWEADKLDGYAEAHPEIKAFRKVGKPSVSIRWGSSKE